MKKNQLKSIIYSPRGIFVLSVFLIASTLILAVGPSEIGASSQKMFASPEDAMKSLVAAVAAKDKEILNQIFGPSGKDLKSKDEVQAATELQEFAAHLAEKTELVKESDSKMILHVGHESWPFPIPIVKKDDHWFFDTEAGKEEILNRRIGEDELTAIFVCRSYVKAQREYALKDWNGDGILAYAMKLRSDTGKKNGLFWRTKPGEELSPFGELIAKARMEGYKKGNSLFKEKPEPFHGYYFKILTKQGKNAPGGKFSYIINGNMVSGFALVAFPSDWGKSGVMTFIVNRQGKVFQKNMGPKTLNIALRMKSYNPDQSWTPVKE